MYRRYAKELNIIGNSVYVLVYQPTLVCLCAMVCQHNPQRNVSGVAKPEQKTAAVKCVLACLRAHVCVCACAHSENYPLQEYTHSLSQTAGFLHGSTASEMAVTAG